MGVVQQFNALIWSWAEMFRALKRGAALGPFLLYAGVQVALLLMLLWFTIPPFRWFMPVLMQWRFGEQALHYPNNFVVMRGFMGDADIVLAVVLGAFVTAAAVSMFTSFYSGGRERFSEGMRNGWSNYLPALVVALVVAALSQLAVRVPMALWGGLADTNPMRFRLLRLMLIGAVVVVQAVFVYAIPAVVVGGRRAGAALAGAAALAFRNPVVTLLVVAVPAAAELLPAWVMRNSNVIIYRFSPEFLTVGMLFWVVSILFINYATVGAATRFYLHATAEEGQAPGEVER